MSSVTQVWRLGRRRRRSRCPAQLRVVALSEGSSLSISLFCARGERKRLPRTRAAHNGARRPGSVGVGVGERCLGVGSDVARRCWRRDVLLLREAWFEDLDGALRHLPAASNPASCLHPPSLALSRAFTPPHLLCQERPAPVRCGRFARDRGVR